MGIERTCQERFTSYANSLRERFRSGLLAQVQPLPQWVVWRGEVEDGKQKKIPYNPNYRQARASVKLPKSWGNLDAALNALETGNFSGVGFIITPPLVLIDLDHSVLKETGEMIDPQAAEIVKAINSYTEISPSRTGIHILVYGAVPGSVHSTIELYRQDRFTTITLNHVPDTPISIESRQEELDTLYRQFAPPVPQRERQNTVGGVGTAQLSALPPEAARDKVLQELVSGDMTRYGNDHHRADWHLLMKLLHWTGDNKTLAKAIFFASPLGQREKAKDTQGKGRRGNTTYVDRTIDRIIERRHNPPMKR